MSIARRSLLTGTVAATVAATARAQPGASPPLPWTTTAPPTGSPADEQRIHTDWAQLEQYRQDNVRVRELPAVERRVVFLGDSITRAWMVFDPEFFTANGNVERGISGQTTQQMLVRLRQDVISLRPAALHLMAGTNDIAENTGPYHPQDTTNNLMSMTELAKLHGIRVILASVPPTAEFPWRTGLQPISKIRSLNEWIRVYAAQAGFVFADYTPILDDGAGAMKSGLSYDGVHPTKVGYLAMDAVASRAIAQALA